MAWDDNRRSPLRYAERPDRDTTMPREDGHEYSDDRQRRRSRSPGHEGRRRERGDGQEHGMRGERREHERYNNHDRRENDKRGEGLGHERHDRHDRREDRRGERREHERHDSHNRRKQRHDRREHERQDRREHEAHDKRLDAHITPKVPKTLPFSARPLARSDFTPFLPLLAHYLAIQKQRSITDMGEREVRGRWGSFRGKWNRGELAAGWYDPEMYARVAEEGGIVWEGEDDEKDVEGEEEEEEEDRDDDYGPLPASERATSMFNMVPGQGASGPTIPTMDDLTVAREASAAAAESARAMGISHIQHARRLDRAEQRERLDELAPRPDAGSHERRVEKRRAVGEKLRASARQTSPGVDEVRDDDLMGGGKDDLKQLKAREQRKKTEREIRRDEWERTMKAQREERIEAWRVREEGTVGMLKELARQRFG